MSDFRKNKDIQSILKNLMPKEIQTTAYFSMKEYRNKCISFPKNLRKLKIPLKRSSLAIQKTGFLQIIMNGLNKISFIKKKKEEKKRRRLISHQQVGHL